MLQFNFFLFSYVHCTKGKTHLFYTFMYIYVSFYIILLLKDEPLKDLKRFKRYYLYLSRMIVFINLIHQNNMNVIGGKVVFRSNKSVSERTGIFPF